jgi:hypothetical protein
VRFNRKSRQIASLCGIIFFLLHRIDCSKIWAVLHDVASARHANIRRVAELVWLRHVNKIVEAVDAPVPAVIEQPSVQVVESMVVSAQPNNMTKTEWHTIRRRISCKIG